MAKRKNVHDMTMEEALDALETLKEREYEGLDVDYNYWDALTERIRAGYDEHDLQAALATAEDEDELAEIEDALESEIMRRYNA